MPHSTPPKASITVVDLVTTDEGKKFSSAGCMATAIVDIMREKGGCLPQDLNAKGFTPAEVVEHWHVAHALAVVEANLMNKDNTSVAARKK